MPSITIRIDGDPMVVDFVEPRETSSGQPSPTVLLIHGWGGSGRYWNGLIERLPRFRFVVPDLPGVGRSLPVRRARSMPDQALAVEALFEQLELGRVHVVGHSMGSGIAMLLAARRPELVDRLVLTSVSLARTERERQAFLLITKILSLSLKARGRWMAEVPALAKLSARRYFWRVPEDPAALREGYLDYLLMDRATAEATARSAATDVVPEAARLIRAPSLLVAGRHDHAMPVANVEYTATVIPGCRVRWIERCGHLPMVEQPDEYAAIVHEFLSQGEGSANGSPAVSATLYGERGEPGIDDRA